MNNDANFELEAQKDAENQEKTLKR